PGYLGTNSYVFLDPAAPVTEHGVIELDRLEGRTRVGFFVGGIAADTQHPGWMPVSGTSWASDRLFALYVPPLPTPSAERRGPPRGAPPRRPPRRRPARVRGGRRAAAERGLRRPRHGHAGRRRRAARAAPLGRPLEDEEREVVAEGAPVGPGADVVADGGEEGVGGARAVADERGV